MPAADSDVRQSIQGGNFEVVRVKRMVKDDERSTLAVDQRFFWCLFLF